MTRNKATSGAQPDRWRTLADVILGTVWTIAIVAAFCALLFSVAAQRSSSQRAAAGGPRAEWQQLSQQRKEVANALDTTRIELQETEGRLSSAISVLRAGDLRLPEERSEKPAAIATEKARQKDGGRTANGAAVSPMTSDKRGRK